MWFRKQHLDDANRPSAHEPVKPPSDAGRARRKAEEDLEQTRERWPEVLRVHKTLRDLREENHFAERWALLFRGEHP